MATREQNEKEYSQWEDLPDGGRRYWYDRQGKKFGFQRLIKTVAPDETTLTFVQEIYDDKGRLIGRHVKYPIDSGHQVIEVQDEE